MGRCKAKAFGACLAFVYRKLAFRTKTGREEQSPKREADWALGASLQLSTGLIVRHGLKESKFFLNLK